VTSFGLKEKEIKDVLISSVNKHTDQMLYLDDWTIDVVDGLADGIAEAIIRHTDKYMQDLAHDAKNRARVQR